MTLIKILSDGIIDEFADASSVELDKRNRYVFSVAFSVPGVASLVTLEGRISGAWHKIITSPITDNDGEISVEIGEFVPDTTIELMFGIQALTKIDKVITLVTNKDKNKVVRFKPSQTFKKLEQSEKWFEEGSIKLI